MKDLKKLPCHMFAATKKVRINTQHKFPALFYRVIIEEKQAVFRVTTIKY